MTCQRVVISGRVQGVWFRDSCRQRAVAAGVTGSVRNRVDGCVEAVFEGPSQAVAELVAWCHTGPPQARVEGVEVSNEKPSGAESFEIVD